MLDQKIVEWWKRPTALKIIIKILNEKGEFLT